MALGPQPSALVALPFDLALVQQTRSRIIPRSAWRVTINLGAAPRWRVDPDFVKSESSRHSFISLITAASRINTVAGDGPLDVARYH
jgi:hypothetical protein